MYGTSIDVLGNMPDELALEASLREREVSLVAGRGVANELKEHFLGLNSSRHGGYSVVGFYEQAADQVFGGSTGAPARDHGDTIGVGTAKVGILLRRYGTAILPGGFLTPKEHMYLAIPNYDFLGVLHGRSPMEFTNLRVVFGRQKDNGGVIGPIGLAADEGGARHADHEDKLSAGARPGKMTKEERAEARERRDEGDEYEDRRVRMKYSRKLSSNDRWAAKVRLEDKGRNLKPGLTGEVLFWLKKQIFQAEDETVLPSDEALLAAGLRDAVAYLETVKPTKPAN